MTDQAAKEKLILELEALRDEAGDPAVRWKSYERFLGISESLSTVEYLAETETAERTVQRAIEILDAIPSTSPLLESGRFAAYAEVAELIRTFAREHGIQLAS